MRSCQAGRVTPQVPENGRSFLPMPKITSDLWKIKSERLVSALHFFWYNICQVTLVAWKWIVQEGFKCDELYGPLWSGWGLATSCKFVGKYELELFSSVNRLFCQSTKAGRWWNKCCSFQQGLAEIQTMYGQTDWLPKLINRLPSLLDFSCNLIASGIPSSTMTDGGGIKWFSHH